jgi:hypothetical protein
MASAIDTTLEGLDTTKPIMRILKELQAATTTNFNTAKAEITALQGAGSSIDSLSDVVITTPTNSQLLQYNGTNWVNATVGSAGEANTASNVGGKVGEVFRSKTGTDLAFRTIDAGAGIGIGVFADHMVISATGTAATGAVLWINDDVTATELGADYICPGFYMYNGTKYIYDYRIQPQPTGEDVTASTITWSDTFGRNKQNYFFKVLSGTGSTDLPSTQNNYFKPGAPYTGHESLFNFLLYPSTSMTFNRGTSSFLYDLTGANITTFTVTGYAHVILMNKGTAWWRLQ